MYVIETYKIPSKLEVAPPPKFGLGEWVIPLRLLRLLEHLAVLKIEHLKRKRICLFVNWSIVGLSVEGQPMECKILKEV